MERRTRVKQSWPFGQVKTNGRIVFNEPAATLLENKPYCTLAYDKENKAIGILQTDAKELNAFAIRHTNRGHISEPRSF